jgi:hypothetical protein
MKRWMFLALTGCSTAYTAEIAVQQDATSTMIQATAGPFTSVSPGLALEHPLDTDRMEGDAAYTAEVLEAAALHVQRMSETERRPVTSAMSMLVTNCPYTRARVMVALTLERELMAMDPSSMSTVGQEGFATLLRGVHAEAAFFRATGADALPLPLPSDYLHSAPHTYDGPTFAASERPVLLSMLALEEVDTTLGGMSTATQESIRASWSVVNPHLGDGIVTNFAERHTRNAMEALIKSESADVRPAGLMGVAKLADELGKHGC